MIKTLEPIGDAGLQAIAETVAQIGITAAQKAAAHLDDPAGFPLPPGVSLEASFFTHLAALPAPLQAKAIANARRLAALPGAGDQAHPLALAGPDLHLAQPVAGSIRAAAPSRGIKIDFAAIAAQRRQRMAPAPALPGGRAGYATMTAAIRSI